MPLPTTTAEPSRLFSAFTNKDKMLSFIITSIGAILTANAESANQRAIGAAVLAAGLNRSLRALEA